MDVKNSLKDTNYTIIQKIQKNVWMIVAGIDASVVLIF